MSWFYSGGKKKKTSFSCLTILGVGVGKEKKNISAPFSSFYSEGEKKSPWFVTLVAPAPPGTLHSRVSFSPCNGWRKESMSQSKFVLFFSFLSFPSLWMERGMGDRGKAAHWYVPSSLLFCFFVVVFQVPLQRPLPFDPLTSSVSMLYFPFCGFLYVLVWQKKKKSPPSMVWNFWWKKKIIQLKQTELCSMV